MQVVQINAITLHERGFVYGALQGSLFWPIAPTICAADYRAPSKPLFQKLGIFDIYSLLSFQVGSFMYLYHMKCYLSLFKTYFKMEVKSVILLLDIPSHTVLMPAEQK